MDNKNKTAPETMGRSDEEIVVPVRDPTLQEVMAHFGYEVISEWHSTWMNEPGQIERLSKLPEVIKTLWSDRRCRITFDYDPTYPKMLLQATTLNPNL